MNRVRRLLSVLVLAGWLSGCMWFASPRCLVDRPEGPLLFGLSLLKGRTMLYEPYHTSVWEASLHVEIYSDGYLHYSNGDYPWCRRLPSDRMERIVNELETIRPLARRDDRGIELSQRDDMQKPVVFVTIPDPEGSDGVLRGRALSWSPLLHDSQPSAESLDPLLCAVEVAMGSGYRFALNEHFGELLEDRGRKEPCRPER